MLTHNAEMGPQTGLTAVSIIIAVADGLLFISLLE